MPISLTVACQRLQHGSTPSGTAGKQEGVSLVVIFGIFCGWTGRLSYLEKRTGHESLDQHTLSKAWSKTSQAGHAIGPHDALRRLGIGALEDASAD